MTEPEITATEAIRLRVWSRQRRAHLARTASDLQIALPQLEAFAQGTGQLPEKALHALTREFFLNAKFDPITDKLIDTSPPPLKAGIVPPPYVNTDLAIAKAQAAYHAALAAARPPAPTRSPEPGQENAGRFAKRPGFAA